VLGQLVDGASSALGEGFCGAYLLGSFALGDADVHSDVDFLVVTHRELADSDQAALQELHSRLFELDVPWAQHLEGSYAPKEQLRTVAAAGSPWFYLDNGASRLVRSDHCNTALVRWVLREHGVVLAGPHPGELVDPVSPDLLRKEARSMLSEYADWAEESRGRYDAGEGLETWTELPFSRWQQPYLVLSFCRILWTLRYGTVTTKREAGAWALEELDSRWSDLIQRALDDRPDPWERTRLPSIPEAVDSTCAFIDDVLDQVSRRS
jgi:hypothetical protein